MPKFLWYFIKSHKKHLLIFIIVSLIFDVAIVVSSFFVSKAIGQLPYLLKDKNFSKYEFYLFVLLLAELFTIVFGIIHTLVYTKLRGYMNIFVRIFGVSKMIELDYSTLAKLGSGKLLQIVKNGIDAYTYLIFDGINRILELLVRIGVLFFVLSYFNLIYLVIFLVGFILIFLVQKYIYEKLTYVREKERHLNEEYTKQTAKIFMNFILLKLANLKEKELEKLYQIGKERVNNYVWLKFWFGAGSRFVNFLITIIFIFSLFYFGKLFLQNKISFELILWISILFMFTRRVMGRLTLFISDLAEKWTYIERFDSLIKLEVSNKKAEDKNRLNWDIFSDFISINFEDIWFKYEGQKLYLFEGFNFSFKRGEKIAILGRSGSGKSTLFKMLVRLVEPEKGKVNIVLSNDEKVDLKLIDPLFLYKKIGYFYQEPLVFDGTIKENLTLGIVNADDEKLKEILKIVELDHLSLDTIVGERGVLLSGGEKQRLALGRAFIFDYEILLLDEPTSNLDLYLEKKILNKIFERYKNKTILVVSHRPYVLKNVDRVIVMKKGEIIFDEIPDNTNLFQIERLIKN